MAALLAALGCRTHREVCEGTGCSVLGTGGTAVAPPEPSAGTGGTAGESGAAEPECARDRDCADDSYCDGSEVCVGGVCAEGRAVDCAHGTSCSETAEQCLYATPSPWLVVTTLDRVLGLPIAELGRRELITLAERPREQVFQGFAGVDWTGDGQSRS